MEVVILGTQGILSDSILSIRNGKTRRQSPLEAVDKPFRFPAKPEDCAPIKFDVYRHVGTARTVSQAGTCEKKLILDTINRGRHAAAIDTGGNMEISYQLRPTQEDVEHTIGSGGIDPTKKGKAELDADEYLEQHKITKFLQSILQGLIKERPLDPYGFIVKQFVEEANAIAAERAAATAESLRQDVSGLLISGAQSGKLEQALQESTGGMLGTKERLQDSAKDVSDLKKLVEQLQLQLDTLEAENRELKELAGETEEDDPLEAEARALFIGAAKDGSLSKALAGASGGIRAMAGSVKGGGGKKRPGDIQTLKVQAGQSMLKGVKDGSLATWAAAQKQTTRESMLMDGNDLIEGSEAVCPADGRSCWVKHRTTTEAMVVFEDGTEKWMDIEDLAQNTSLVAADDLEVGDSAVRLTDKQTGIVRSRTTTELLIEFKDGTEAWHDAEDLAQAVAKADDLKEGDEALKLGNSRRGRILTRTTTDMKLKLEDGTEEWVATEDLGAAKARMPKAPAKAAEAPGVTSAPAEGQKAAAPSAGAPAPDLSHVLALQRELELLAKDRAAMMMTVQGIQEKLASVKSENERLAAEVRSRPLSPTASARTTELAEKYAAK